MDGPSTSRQEISTCFDPSPNAQLTLRADPDSKELMKCDESEVEFAVNLGKLDLEELIVEPWFQDNTMVFDVLLNDRKSFVMCVYPPGSGKSTMAQILKFYLSANGMHEEIRKFLDTCEFQLKENELAKGNPSYKKFRASASYVLVADFNEIDGGTQGGLELNYTLYMEQCWLRSGLPEQTVNRELENLRTVKGSVWTSLERLRDSIHPASGELYVILDSVDNMYNLIANLPPEESKKLYNRFTKGIATIIHKGTRSIKTFCFGVSPYLIKEYQKYAISCHYIGNNHVGQYFSYQDTKIQDMIDLWNLGIEISQCKDVTSFQYNTNHFVNPYLCVSYLKSLYEKGSSFSINLSPRSLWRKCIFSEDDLNLLYGVLSGEKEFNFNMNVSMETMCLLPEESKSRHLFYPLFVYGGYLSCKKGKDKNAFLLSSANESSKLILKHHLLTLHYRKFRIEVAECEIVLKEYLAECFDSYCEKLSLMLTAQSSYIIREEKPYHTFMSGILSPLMFANYEVIFDKEYSIIKPDTIIRGKTNDKLIIEEYKHVIPPDYIPKKACIAVEGLDEPARCKKLKEFYTPLEKVKKSKIVKLCQEAVSDARLQLSDYAPQFSSMYKKDVDINILVFYISQVILLRGKYFHNTCEFSNYEIFSSKGYFDKADLNSILNLK